MTRCTVCNAPAVNRYYTTHYCRDCSPADYAFQCVSCRDLFDAVDLGWSGFHSCLCVECATPELIAQQIRQWARKEPV